MPLLRPPSAETVAVLRRAAEARGALHIMVKGREAEQALSGIAKSMGAFSQVVIVHAGDGVFATFARIAAALNQARPSRAPIDPRATKDARKLLVNAASEETTVIVIRDAILLDPETRLAIADVLTGPAPQHTLIFVTADAPGLSLPGTAHEIQCAPLTNAQLRALLQDEEVVQELRTRTAGSLRRLEQWLTHQNTNVETSVLDALSVVGPCSVDTLSLFLGLDLSAEALLATGEVLGTPDAIATRPRELSAATANSLHARAEQFFADDPVKRFHHALASSSATADMCLAAAEIHAANGARVRAADVLRRGAALGDLRVTEALADTLVNLGSYREALPHALATQHRPRGLARLVRVYTQLGRFADALSTIPLDSADPSLLAQRAELSFQMGNYAMAAAIAETLTSSDAQLDAFQTLAKVSLYLKPGSADAAYRAYETAARAFPDEGVATEHVALAVGGRGVAALRKGEPRRARALLTQAHRLATEHRAEKALALSCINLAVLAHREHDYSRARELYEEGLQHLKVTGHAISIAWCSLNLGELYESMGGTARAQTLALSALAGASDNPRPRGGALLLLGRIALAEGRLDDAELSLTNARDLLKAHDPVRAEAALVELCRVALAGGDANLALTLSQSETPSTRAHEVDHAIIAARATDDLAAALDAVALADTLPRDLRRQLKARLTRLQISDCGTTRAEAHACFARIRETVPASLKAEFDQTDLARALARPRARVSSKKPSSSFVVACEKSRRLLSTVERVGPSPCSVLVLGESGVGKELIAERIHLASGRTGEMVRVNCAALVESLLMSELFGHERGAFTGAIARKRGRFEAADRGTIFLDEVGEIAPRVQAALLRVLQERTFERVGGRNSIKVDVRIIAATNRDLPAMVEAGTFRRDLFYRLNAVTLLVPPLRERVEEIVPLAEAFLAADAKGRRLDEAARDALRRHGWPGNVRQLKNVMKSASIFAEGDTISVDDLGLTPAATESPAVQEAGSDREPPVDYIGTLMSGENSLREIKKILERDCIAHALAQTDGNITRAAALLGMKRPRLSQLVKEHGLKEREPT